MCAKVAQNHETKEERVKNPSKVLWSQSPKQPLYKEILRILTKIRKKSKKQILFLKIW